MCVSCVAHISRCFIGNWKLDPQGDSYPHIFEVFAKGLVVAAGYLSLAGAMHAQTVDWPYYGGDQGGMKYSTLTQIGRSNVSKLTLAWQWKTGEKDLAEYQTKPGVFEDTPLVADGTMYVVTPYNRVVALDPLTGTEKWSYDPESYKAGQPPNGTGFVHRGVALEGSA